MLGESYQGLESVFRIDRYEVNNVPDEMFTHQPGPGTLVLDRDTDLYHQVPGGLEHLEVICERVMQSARGAAATERPGVRAWPVPLLAALVCGAAVSAVLSAWFTSRRRGR